MGLFFVLKRVLVPEPHVFEHEPHDPHLFQVQSTGTGLRRHAPCFILQSPLQLKGLLTWMPMKIRWQVHFSQEIARCPPQLILPLL